MNQPINPDDFIISRKRKKYRFAKFANAKNCFEMEEWQQHRTELPAVDVLEVGAGTGLFSVELAARNPEKTFVALDVKADRLQKGAYQALERGLENIYFLRARADQVRELFVANSLQSIWVTFPDPFPRARSAGRRMTHSNYLDKYAAILATDGCLLLKHDNQDFFAWSLEQLVAKGWRLMELSFDLHESDLPGDYKIMTTYEKRWLDEGRKTNFVRAGY